MNLVYERVMFFSLDLAQFFQMFPNCLPTTSTAMINAKRLMTSPLTLTNGPMMLLGSWPLRNKIKVAYRARGISIALAITPPIH